MHRFLIASKMLGSGCYTSLIHVCQLPHLKFKSQIISSPTSLPRLLHPIPRALTALIQKQHPLRVSIVLRCKDGSSLNLTFHYLTFFKIVAVLTKLNGSSSISGGGSNGCSGSNGSSNGLLDAQTLLDCLVESGDLGKDSPNAANRFHIAAQVGNQSFVHLTVAPIWSLFVSTPDARFKN